MYLSKKLIIRLCGNKKLNKDFDFNKVSSILIRPVGDAVGDAIAHIGYVQQLKALYPSSRIGVLVTDRNRDVYAHCALIDNLIDEKLFDYWKNRKKWQILLDFHESFTSMHIIGCALLSPQINMIFSKREKKYYNLQTLNHYDFHCPPRPNTHMADHLLDSKFAEYFPLERAKFTLTASEAELKQAAAYWKPRHQKVRVLLAPPRQLLEAQHSSARIGRFIESMPSRSAYQHSVFNMQCQKQRRIFPADQKPMQ